MYAQIFYAVLVVCVVSTLNTYYGQAVVAMEPWALGLLAASLFIFLLCILLVYRQPQTRKKVSFMVCMFEEKVITRCNLISVPLCSTAVFSWMCIFPNTALGFRVIACIKPLCLQSTLCSEESIVCFPYLPWQTERYDPKELPLIVFFSFTLA